MRQETWEIRHPTKAGVVSSVKNCGYDDRTLASLYANGYTLHCDGKEVPRRKKGDASGKKS